MAPRLTSSQVPVVSRTTARSRMARWRRAGAILSGLLLIVLVAGCDSGSENQEPDESGGSSGETDQQSVEVELALNWFPEAEHGGYYAALVHGYFREAGFDVTITPGGPGVPVIQNVGAGRVPFAISNADQILIGRAREADVVAVFAPLQTSPRCIMVHEKSGIRKFEDLKNITLAINENSSFGSLLKRRVSLEGCQIVPYPGNVSRFLQEEDFAQQGYVFSEPFVAKKEGGDPHNLMAADLGFNPYTSVLITHGDRVRDDPEMVGRFVKAVQAGWIKYLAEPARTNEYINEQNPEMDLDILEFGAAELKKLCLNDSVSEFNLGTMTEERWSDMTAQLVECEIVEEGLKGAEAFTTEFLGDDSASKGVEQNDGAVQE